MKGSETHIRAFIAISLPSGIKQGLKDLQKQLRTSGIKASWPKPAAMHVTLKFLGSIDIDTVDLVKKSMEKATSAMSAFTIRAAGMGVFPSVKNTRIIWSGITGQTMVLEKIVNDLETHLLKGMGIQKEKKRYLPHLTVARIKQPVSTGKMIQTLQAYKHFETDNFLVSRIELYKSELTASGAQHEQLFSVTLGRD